MPALFVNSWGDCFEPRDLCERVGEVKALQVRVLLLGVAPGLTVLGVLAVGFGRTLFPAVLLLASAALLVLQSGPKEIEGPLAWVPIGLGVLTPAVLVLAIASAWQIAQELRLRRLGATRLTRGPGSPRVDSGDERLPGRDH